MKPTRDELLARGLKVLTRLPREDWGAGWAGVLASAATWNPDRGGFDSYCRHKARFAVVDQARRETGRRAIRKGGTHLERERPWDVDEFGDPMTHYAPASPDTYAAREQIRYLASLLPTRRDRAIFIARSRGWSMKRVGVWLGICEAMVSLRMKTLVGIIRARGASEVLA